MFLHVGPKKRAGTEKFVGPQSGNYVGHRQTQSIDRELRRVAERDQRTALFDELAQRLNTFIADASRVATRDSAGLHPFDNLPRGHLGNDDRIELRPQVSSLHVVVVQNREGEMELFEDPLGPAFIDIACPGLV